MMAVSGSGSTLGDGSSIMAIDLWMQPHFDTVANIPAPGGATPHSSPPPTSTPAPTGTGSDFELKVRRTSRGSSPISPFDDDNDDIMRQETSSTSEAAFRGGGEGTEGRGGEGRGGGGDGRREEAEGTGRGERVEGEAEGTGRGGDEEEREGEADGGGRDGSPAHPHRTAEDQEEGEVVVVSVSSHWSPSAGPLGIGPKNKRLAIVGFLASMVIILAICMVYAWSEEPDFIFANVCVTLLLLVFLIVLVIFAAYHWKRRYYGVLA